MHLHKLEIIVEAIFDYDLIISHILKGYLIRKCGVMPVPVIQRILIVNI